MQALHPNNEAERLETLRQFSILDSFTERDYDDITYLASIICNTKVALISFVDDDRQWFKSHKGIDMTQSPREHSFCAHAILSPNETLVVEDSREDVRFKDNPLVTGDPNIVFYAGVPLVTEDGFGLGTVCVLDTKPQKLNEVQITALKMLSRQVMSLLNIRKSNLNLKLSEAQLQLQNTKLDSAGKKLELTIEQLVSERVKEIATQNVALEEMNKELQAFNYISSHDLQEPLRKIQIFTSLLIEKESDRLSEKGNEYLAKIEGASSRMRALITDLLAYSRSTFAEKIFQKMTINEIVNRVKSNMEEEIEEKNATVELLSDCEIYVIPYQIEQLLYNLISNSIKFAKLGVMPWVKIYCDGHCDSYYSESKLLKESRYAKITVRDNGIGFDNAYNEKIFELFQRLGNREIRLGTGIGLAIVKKIIENHAGFVIANSAIDQGTTFEIYIPELQKQAG